MDPPTKRLWQPGKYDVVCSSHFKDTDYKITLLGERPRLNKGAVPSIFPFALSLSSNDFLNDESPRCLRRKNREGILVTNDQHAPVCTEVLSVVEVKDTPEIQNSSSIETPAEDLHGQFDQSVQCELKTFGKFSVKIFELALFFGISESSVSRIFNTWLYFMY